MEEKIKGKKNAVIGITPPTISDYHMENPSKTFWG